MLRQSHILIIAIVHTYFIINISTDMAGNSELENAQLGGYADYITDLNLKVVQVFFYEPDQAKKVISKTTSYI